jgi:hypothetical protein
MPAAAPVSAPAVVPAAVVAVIAKVRAVEVAALEGERGKAKGGEQSGTGEAGTDHGTAPF